MDKVPKAFQELTPFDSNITLMTDPRGTERSENICPDAHDSFIYKKKKILEAYSSQLGK